MAIDYNGVGTNGSANPQSINTNWFGEAWKLFAEHAGTWVPATAITFYGPAVIDLYILFLTKATHNLGATVEHPTALIVGVALFNVIFVVYMLNGLGNLAVRQVAGAHITFADVFSGSRNFAGTLLWLLLVGAVLFITTSLIIYPGVLVAALLIPSFAIVASGGNLIESLNKSIQASKSDRLNGRVVAFLLGLLLLLGSVTGGLALLVTLPFVLLVSALAYRDLIGLPGLAPGPGFRPINADDNRPDVALDDSIGAVGPRVTLTGESLDEL